MLKVSCYAKNKMEDKVILLGYLTEEKHLSERIIDAEGICFTLMAMTHGYGQGYILEDDRDIECGQ